MFSASKTAGPSGYNLTNSLRFRRSATAFLQRTPASAGNRKTFTWSGWVKRGLSGNNVMFQANQNSSYGQFSIGFSLNTTDDIGVYNQNAATTNLSVSTNAVFRDFSAWYHIVVAVDTTQATAANRVLIYVNGVLQSTTISTQVAQNTDLNCNNTIAHNIGKEQTASGGSANYFDGYMDEINFIDGQALTPSSFGSTNTTTGVWQPARYSGTYGTNGFYLNFTDIALTSGSNAGLGKDFSGNGNYWNTNNISVTAGTTYDAMSDVPTLTSATVANYCTLNPNLRQTGTGQAPTSANLKLTANTTGYSQVCCATIASTSGKFYWEVTVNGGYGGFGIADSNNSAFTSVVCTTSSVTANPGQYTWGWNLEISNGNKQNNNVSTSYGSAASSGDVYMCAVDIDNGKVWWGKNGTWFASGNPASGTNAAFTNVSGNIIPYFSPTDAGGWTQDINFGQRPFSYTPPTGFVRLNTYNLPDSTIKKGSSYMDAVLWTGAGQTGAASITGLNFKPDFVWAKMRSSAISHTLYNSIVGGGANKALSSNGTDTEASFNANATNGYLSSFDSNGFSYFGGSSPAYFSSNGNTYVGWAWQAGQGSTSSNTDGSVASTVSVNSTAGFSVVTYTGTGVTNATVGHGLGVAAKMVIVKNRTTNATSNNWWFIHANLTAGNNLYLNTTTGQFSVSGATTNGGLGSLTSTTFTLASGASNSNNTNQSGTTYVAYCWAEIAGFSNFSSYTGNGSADGPFVYLGFRPKFVMIKRRDTTSGWNIYDSSRNTYNVVDLRLLPNTSDAEATVTTFDFLSNGFKLRTSDADRNASGGTYIYAAFAENPFKNALAR